MNDISHEEIGDSCNWCGNGGAMCGCIKCVDCLENYDAEDIKHHRCPDCLDDFMRLDLEERLERIL